MIWVFLSLCVVCATSLVVSWQRQRRLDGLEVDAALNLLQYEREMLERQRAEIHPTGCGRGAIDKKLLRLAESEAVLLQKRRIEEQVWH